MRHTLCFAALVGIVGCSDTTVIPKSSAGGTSAAGSGGQGGTGASSAQGGLGGDGTAGSAGSGGTAVGSGGAAGSGSTGGSAGIAGMGGDAGASAGTGGATGGTGGATGGTGGAGGVAAVIPPSCQGLGDICGGESCCESPLVPGGSFVMGTDNVNAPAAWKPAHSVTVSEFRLDRYEVTVGRFRRFVEAYPASLPKGGDGAHPRIPGSGWIPNWGGNLPASATELGRICDANTSATHCTWTDTPGSNEDKPMNGLTWYAAFAFCAWDGGRLPTEAEWEYAAAGGQQQSVYPWGGAAIDCERANIGKPDHTACGGEPLAVGGRKLGEARWHQLDMVGNVSEFVLDWSTDDWYSTGGATCSDCANLTDSALYRVRRGGAFSTGYTQAPVYFRDAMSPTYVFDYIGVRCARDVR